ncbi:MAG: serine kinase [Chloroflexi bacterium]|nr:serine kinase [Chloroflexota bacterium]MBP6802591.1 serine kinase [Chloroflexota bacterium]
MISAHTTDDQVAAFFEAAHTAYRCAEQSASDVSLYDYVIAGFHVRLRFAGAGLPPQLSPALAHLAVAPSASPDLTVCLWDTCSTGVSMPRPPWPEEDYLARGEIRGYNTERFRTVYDVWGGAFRMLDQERNLALFWTQDARQLPTYDRGAPLRMILHWWMRCRGLLFVHAGAVGTEKGGILLAGKSGSGKSTTATACLLAGLRYAGDDYCLISTKLAPRVYSLYNSVKLDPAILREKMPDLATWISNPAELDREKALIFLHQPYPAWMAKTFPIRALLLPTTTGREETVLIRASAAASLQALAPSTLMQMPGADGRELQALAKFVKQVPGYHLQLGTKLAEIPRMLEQLLEGNSP